MELKDYIRTQDKVISNETINYDLSEEPLETDTKTKTSTTLWQNIFKHIKWLRTNFSNYALLSHTHSTYATTAQGAKADTAIQGVKKNGTLITPDGSKIVDVNIPTKVTDLSDYTDFAQLDVNGKIIVSNLPDYILGQVLFGGTIDINLDCLFTQNYITKYSSWASDNIANLDTLANEGVYFIARDIFTFNSIDFEVGDWVISIGSDWVKIDNTDAVASVNGNTGAVSITLSSLGAAAATHNHDGIYLKTNGTSSMTSSQMIPYLNAQYVGGISVDMLAKFMYSPATWSYIKLDLDSGNGICKIGWKTALGVVITSYKPGGTDSFGQSNSYDALILYQCPSGLVQDIDTGVSYPVPTNNHLLSSRPIWTDSPSVVKYRHKLTEGIYGAFGTYPADTNLTTILMTTISGISGYYLKNNSLFLFELNAVLNHTLNLTTLLSNLKLGMTYKMICKNSGTNSSRTLTITDTIGNRVNTLVSGQWFFIEFVKVNASTVICTVFDVR